MLNDIHCHFFSPGFFRALVKDAPPSADDPAETLPATLGWEPPSTNEDLADRWIAELDRNGVTRAMLIASAPGDEASVAAAVARHPSRTVGAFMLNPAADDLDRRLDRAFGDLGLRTACLFPAMHGLALDDPRTARVFDAASRHRGVVFVHCGVLSIGIRKKLGLPCRFDLRQGDPLGVAAVAVRYPDVPVIIPHFGAGFLREALIAADQAANIMLDTSSSNGWIKFEPGLTLRDVFLRALDVVGPGRLVFGTDSSFFPRGWQKAIYDAQNAILVDVGIDDAARRSIFGDNFTRLFALPPT